MDMTGELGLRRAGECLELAALVSEEGAGSLLTRMADIWPSIAKRSETRDAVKSERCDDCALWSSLSARSR
jgi:hypothetical protein